MLSQDGKPCGKDSKSSLCFDADLISYNASISACSSDPTHIAAEPENGHESWWLSHIWNNRIKLCQITHESIFFLKDPWTKSVKEAMIIPKLNFQVYLCIHLIVRCLCLSLSLCLSIYFAVWCILILQGFCAYHRLRKNSWLCTSRSSKLLAGRTCPCPICFVILCYPDTSSEIMYLHSHISTHQKLF